jgi:hypothetical protein
MAGRADGPLLALGSRMALAEILCGLVVLVGVIAGFAGVPVLNPKRLIHISIRVRLARPEEEADALGKRTASRVRKPAARKTAPSPRLFATSMMLLNAQRSPMFDVGSRWG